MANVSITLSVPDTAVPRIRRAFGGATNAETVANVREYLLEQLRLKVRQINAAEKGAALSAALVPEMAAEDSAFETDWP